MLTVVSLTCHYSGLTSWLCIMSCCICESCISTSKGKNRYRKLHGEGLASKSVKATLEACVEESFGVTLDAFDLDNQSCIVCYECTQKLDKIAKLEDDLQKLKAKIVEQFQLNCSASDSTLTGAGDAVSNSITQPSSSQLGTPSRVTADNRSRASSGPMPHPKRRKVVVRVETGSVPLTRMTH